MTLKSGSMSTICNAILSLKVINQYTKFEETRFILSQDIVWKPPSIENRSTAPLTLTSRSRSTIYNPVLAPEVDVHVVAYQI